MKLRTKAIVLSLTFVFVFFVIRFLDLERFLRINNEVLRAVLVSLVFFGGLAWVLNFRVKGVRVLTVLGHSAFTVFIQSLFLELIIFQDASRISEKTISLLILLVWGIVIYFLILTVNILNISFISQIPLGQAAKASSFVYYLFTAYFAFLLILKSGADLPVKLIFFIIVISINTITTFWFKKESSKQLLTESGAVIIFMLTVFVLLVIWPLPVELASMFLIIIYYILLGLGLEQRETTSLLMRIEYFIILGFAVVFLLKLSIWGINGTII
ncbi:MAG: hypothetical protein PHS44_07010 [Candidatus Dojkabacteria bacterium]|jgi:hypothetical protein|nr:hypothetical protein [Candidatus Dojkabacteria bacterium]